MEKIYNYTTGRGISPFYLFRGESVDSKIIFMDIDGTLCTPNGEVPETAQTAIRKARKNGHQIYLCTGRSQPEILDCILSIGFDGVIGAGGGHIEIGGKVVHHQTMAQDSVLEITDYFDKHNIGYYLESNEGLFGSANCIEAIRSRVTEGYPTDSEAYLNADAEFNWFYELIDKYQTQKIDYSKVNKISFISNEDHPFVLINNRFRNKFEIYRTTVAQFGLESGEIALKDVNKLSAIDFVLQYLGKDKMDTMAYGDGNNDIKMFEAVAYGVAMENASEELKKVSQEITSKAEDDGIHDSFKLNGLI
jgi:Cof subfamily protein (haloacid dehalogenase superfamily)